MVSILLIVAAIVVPTILVLGLLFPLGSAVLLLIDDAAAGLLRRDAPNAI